MTARDPNDYPRDHKPGTHWATALAAIALITATGMSHAAPPPDVVTGAGIKPLALFYPPKEFDHPYAGTLIITPAVNIEEVHRYCLPTPAALGCARIGRDTCEVIVAPEIQLKAFGWTTADVIRHETAHCNGWPGDHRGRRSRDD